MTCVWILPPIQVVDRLDLGQFLRKLHLLTAGKINPQFLESGNVPG